MTLINRVSAFFLLALGLCLAGYSAAMYWMISGHLLHHFDLHLEASLNVLVAAIEVETDGVKWQPSDHAIQLGDKRVEDEVRWIIVNERGQTVDSSHNLKFPGPAEKPLLALARRADPHARIHDDGRWRSLQRRLTCPDPKPVAERDLDEAAAMTITVAQDDRGLHADLWRLKLLALLLPIVLWTMAAIAGRAYCRRALRPVGSMAARARSMTNADFNLRLPVSNSPDELASLANAFNSLLDRLQQAYQQQQRFSGDAAHQLRTPLTILRGEIDVARRRPREAEEHQQILARLSDQTRELQDIVEALLFLARAEGDAPLPDLAPISLSAWFPAYVDHWKSHPRFGDLAVSVEQDLTVHASETLLRQALDNLLGNAWKYSPPGTPVMLAAIRQGTQVGISVTDQGAVIAAEEREALFEPFYRSPNARLRGIPGTGLGLAIVARIAQALGGQATCQPAGLQGNRFTLLLPASSPPNP